MNNVVKKNTTMVAWKKDNIKKNWDQNEEIGSNMIRKRLHHTRFYFLNPNGISLANNGLEYKMLCETIIDQGMDFTGYMEINIDTWCGSATKIFYDISRSTFNQSKLNMSSSSIPVENFYKPGGVMSIIQGNLKARIIAQDSDRYGRWVTTTLSGRSNKVITVITAYQPCKVSKKLGVTTYHQQIALLKQDGRDECPRQAFVKDLIKMLTHRKSNGKQIILGGDFNETLSVKSNLLQICMNENLQLVDILDSTERCNKSSSLSGRSIIDYIFISQELVHAIRKKGYNKFDQIKTTDHRGMFLDMDTEVLFGNGDLRLANSKSRILKANDPFMVKEYIEKLHKYLTDQSFWQKHRELIQSDKLQATKIEIVDKILLDASLHAERRCQTKPRCWWSLPLAKAKFKLNTLKTQLSRLKSGANPIQKQSKYGIIVKCPQTIHETQVELIKTQKEIKKIIRKSVEKRRESNETLAEIHALTGNTDKAKILKSIINAEKMQQVWKKIGFADGKSYDSSLSSLQIPVTWPTTETGDVAIKTLDNPKKTKYWKTVDTPKEIAFYLKLRNKLHFGQAHGTPFTIPPLSEEIDWSANSKQSEIILEGSYKNQELTYLQDLLLQHCRKEQTETLLGHQIRLDEFKDRIRVWKEKTTTSPSGKHLGHYKALIGRSPYPPDSAEGIIFKVKQQELLQIHLDMVNYALKHRYSYKRWQNIVNVIIPKEKGNNKIHRIRILHLYEADYSAFTGIKWRDLIKSSEGRGTLNKGQMGGRAGQDATTLTYMEELKNDICHCSRKALINFDNDAAACYDRIIPNLANLIGRKKGLHRNVTFVHAKTLSEAKFKLKTALGVSEDFYQHCKAFPIYGTGQGSTNSPIIWLIISSTLFDIHDKLSKGATFCNPKQTIYVHLSVVGFVDDVTGQTNKFLDNNVKPEELINQIQHDAQLWSELLWISGGHLELDKCSYHVIYYAFLSDGTPTMVSHQPGPPLRIKEPDSDKYITIPFKNVYTTHNTLGHQKSPGGVNAHQKTVLRENANSYAIKGATSSLSHNEAKMYYDSCYTKSVGYVLGQCFFSEKECEEIEDEAVRTFTSKIGYNQNMAKVIRDGPIDIGGVSLTKLYDVQGTEQIKNFLRHIRSDSQATHLTKIAIAWAQHQCGWHESILHDVASRLPHFEARWLKSLRKYLKHAQATMELQNTYVYPLQRINDEHIMTKVIQSKKFKDKDIKRINYCRMYLNVTTISDVTLANGKTLDPLMLKGTTSLYSSKARSMNINQGKPNQVSWGKWRSAMKLWAVGTDLKKPLKEWLTDASMLERHWFAYYDYFDNNIYVHSQNKFIRYIRKHEHCGQFVQGEASDWIPNRNSVPIHVTTKDGALTWEGEWCWGIHRILLNKHEESFDTYVSKLPEWESELISKVEVTGNIYTAMENMTASGFLIATDGSADETTMSFGWKMCTLKEVTIATHAGPAYGDSSSFRSEAYGVLSAVCFMKHARQYTQTDKKLSFTVYLDNKSVITRIKQQQEYTFDYSYNTLEPDWDVISQIVNEIQAGDFNITFEHIKGHQDTKETYENLPLPARLNVDVDRLAVAFRVDYKFSTRKVICLPCNPVQLHIGNTTITSRYTKKLVYSANATPLLQYIAKRQLWSKEKMATVHWEAFRIARKHNFNRKQQIVKMLHGILPTNKQLYRYKKSNTDKCPLCHRCEETRNHLLVCSSVTSQKWRKNIISDLHLLLKQLHTEPKIAQTLTNGIKQVLGHNDIEEPECPELYRAQLSMGFISWFDGLIHVKWAEYQEEHLREKKLWAPNSDGQQWAVQIIKFIWEKFFALWTKRNEKVHGPEETARNALKAERYKAILETMYHHKERLLASDRQYMFQSLSEVEEFLQTKSLGYIKMYINIWYPCFKRGIKKSQQQAIKGVKLLTSYFSRISKISKRDLPLRFTSRYDGLKRDETKQDGKKKRTYKMNTLYNYFQ